MAIKLDSSDIELALNEINQVVLSAFPACYFMLLSQSRNPSPFIDLVASAAVDPRGTRPW